jgi:ABC-2 type transport system ATP-binding protein
LSGGQQQRLALALALVNDPELLFLDEPTTGLDPQSRRALWEIIVSLQAEGKTVVLTTHYMEEAQALCHRVGIIDHGKIIALGTPEALVGRLDGTSTITTSTPMPLDNVREFPEVVQVEYGGDLLRIQTSDIVATLSALLELAKRSAIRLQDIQISRPSLEDVFLQLTGRTIREA